MTILKNMKVSWEGLSHILWKTKMFWNHQPDNYLPVSSNMASWEKTTLLGTNNHQDMGSKTSCWVCKKGECKIDGRPNKYADRPKPGILCPKLMMALVVPRNGISNPNSVKRLIFIDVVVFWLCHYWFSQLIPQGLRGLRATPSLSSKPLRLLHTAMPQGVQQTLLPGTEKLGDLMPYSNHCSQAMGHIFNKLGDL